MRFKKSKKQEKTEEVVCVSSPDKKEIVCSPGGSVTKVEGREPGKAAKEGRGNTFIGTLNFFAAPYRYLREGYEKKYSQAKKLFILDLIFLVVLGLLIGFNVYLFISRSISLSGVRFWEGRPKTETAGKDGDVLPPASFELATQIKINDQERLIVNPGEDLKYVVSYYNSGKKDIYDVALKINLEGAILDFDRVEPGRGSIRGKAIVWTKDQVSDFAGLPAGAKGELKFKIGTAKTAEPPRALNFGSILKSWAELSYKLESGFSESVNSTGAVREDKINSDLMVQALARYFTPEGDQLGRGPLPPAVGKTTKYWIFWSVENNLNDVSDVSVSAVLPPNVQWTENISVSLGDLSYNPARRTILWRVGDVGRYSGEEWSRGGAAFEVALLPALGQVGQEASLLDQIKIFGTDRFSGQFLERRTSDVTTNLIYDSLAKGGGKVAK